LKTFMAMHGTGLMALLLTLMETASADQGDWYFTNNSADFSDSVRTNMTQITAIARTGSGFISAVASVDNFFIATSVSGGSSTTFLTDQHFGSTAADRVVRVGGAADNGASAGAFDVAASNDSSFANREYWRAACFLICCVAAH
jgi:hypothetical protein